MLATGIAAISATGFDIKIEDLFLLIDNASANPAAYGLLDTTTTVWSGGVGDPTSGTSISTNPLVQNQYLFFDHMHLTQTGQLAVASGAQSILSGGVQCFAEGTRIDTKRGPIAVERLSAGDLVRLAEGGEAPVVWLGYRTIDCGRHPRPWDVQPVRVRANAFAPGRPRRDILLSPDHAIRAGGGLIPVRYLANGASIVQEAAGRITYWHVELAAHAFILAEGLACESYLDTGNRAAFANGGIVALHPDFDSRAAAEQIWAERACAPLIREDSALNAVRATLLRRMPRLGFAVTREPGLHLIAGGSRIAPRLVHGGMHRFALPPGVTEVMIRSTSGVPAEHDPGSQDRRRLGVMIAAMIFRRSCQRHDLPLDEPHAGFNPVEHDGAKTWRWTDGAGVVAIPESFAGEPCLLDLHIAAVQPSWQSVPCVKRVATAARRGQFSAHA